MNTPTDTHKLLKTFLKDITQKNNLNQAIEGYLTDVKSFDNLTKISEIPFSSERKYSASIYKDLTLVLGAPEMLLAKDSKTMKEVGNYTEQSFRVVVFGKIRQAYSEKKGDIKNQFIPLSIIAIDDPIREEAPGTLSKLIKENIQYRIISGDSPDTVLAIAKKINKKYPANVINGEELDTLKGEELSQAILNNNIFARIKPRQKQLIIRTLKEHKLFTIMIGDGVNDVLAIKESDLGVAMNRGSSMAKDVADVVLLNNSFSTLPVLLYEGRRIIANIQTIANIYLIKNISSIASILMLGFIGLRFPFDPKHVELSSLLIIGIPSLALAFEKHSFSTTDEGFIKRLLFFSGVVGFGNAVIYTVLYTYYDIVSEQLFYSRSILLTSVIFLGINNIILIYLQHYNLGQIVKRKIVTGLISGIFVLFGLSLLFTPIRSFFEISEVNPIDILITFGFCLTGSMLIFMVLRKLHLLNDRKIIQSFKTTLE